MEARGDLHLRGLISRMRNGMAKVVAGVRRCGKTCLLFSLFGEYLRNEAGADDGHRNPL